MFVFLKLCHLVNSIMIWENLPASPVGSPEQHLKRFRVTQTIPWSLSSCKTHQKAAQS